MFFKISFILLILIKIIYSSTLTDIEKLANAKKLIEKINLEAKGWKAKLHERFAKMDDKHLKLLGENLTKRNTNEENNNNNNNNRRKRQATCTDNVAFDARTAFPSCADIIGSIQDQSSCGDCWAVSVASAFTDRYCIENEKVGNPPASDDPTARFSAIDLASCTPNTSGCGGGDPYRAWLWTKQTGVVTGTDNTWATGCEPYPFPPHADANYTVPSCSSSCTTNWNTNFSTDKRFSVWTGFLQGPGNNAAMQNEIRANGSVVAAFDRTPSAIYKGGHAVRVIGWGTQTCSDGTSTDYWLAANQWNTDWGLQGYFKIVRGTDECGFETKEISFGTPNIN
ncbi:Pept_C1 domain-containing protein [Meloidogyne graminicola]|uniref:Pept_C1 domain-containing protein n=1 Tax=Meloidogyne graminicola TaxID=189291 RepID=A0A8S9ZWS1_9BILA|nr:Pept_C1 domain-containing protein [Meloidogyne graminicola]